MSVPHVTIGPEDPCPAGGEHKMAAVTDRPVVRLMAQCRRCGGWLYAPASVAASIGPTCAAQERAEQAAATERPLTLFDSAA
ncbi:DUF6011 domain-containing protein [Nocardia sp. 852002-51244_SCH5132740]|uniref:DUF6011 domain-containing protein n=1 Tax=Nocardia sp. 852002-51244_SCH5132740 TaxID=1834099 RepID=UPI0035136419